MPLMQSADVHNTNLQPRALPIASLRGIGRPPSFIQQVETPEESKGEWDLAKIIATVPGQEAFWPLNEGGCPLVDKR